MANGLTDWNEVDTKSGLITWDENGDIVLPTFAQCVRKKGETLFYVEKGLVRYTGMMNILNDIKVLPIVSDPTSKDGDGDGIMDKDDTAPLAKGLEGDVVGELTIVSCHLGAIYKGHAFLVYKSYINDILDFSGFYKGYNLDTWNKIEPQNKYAMSVNEYVSIGNSADTDIWGENFDSGDDLILTQADLIGGIYFNREFYNYMRLFKEGKEKYSYLSNAALTKKITADQLSTVIKVHNKNNSYNFLKHNCAYVACLAWNTAFNDDLNSKETFIYMVKNGMTIEPRFITAYIPKVLKESIKESYNATTEFDIGKLF